MVEESAASLELQRLFDERHLHVLEHVMFRHQGVFDHQDMMVLLKKIEREMVIREPILSVRKRVFDVATEMLENIIHHAANNHEREPILILSEQSRDYLLMSVNVTDDTHKDKLSYLLNTISLLGKNELNGLYKDVMRGRTNNGIDTLGLIRVAKKLKDPIAYHYKPLADGQGSYFAVIAAIPK